MTRTLLILSVTLLLGVLPTAGLFAADETNISAGLTAEGHGLAAHGYDVVAYQTAGRPTLGTSKYSTVFGGATYRFASRSNLRTFKADPARYQPQYGGFCAYGVSVGAKFDGDPRLWKLVDGKLYFNLNEDIQKTWSKDIPANISKANSQWRKIAGTPAAQLK